MRCSLNFPAAGEAVAVGRTDSPSAYGEDSIVVALAWLAAVVADLRPSWPFSQALAAADLVALADREGVVALVDARLHVLADDASCPAITAPDPVRQAFRGAARESALLSMLLEGEARRMLALMADAGLPGLLLKGQALGQWAYAVPHWRASSDMDVLVPTREAAQMLADRLSESGYQQPQPSGELVSFEFMCRREVVPGVCIEADLHHRLVNSPLFSDLFAFDELMSESIPLPALGANARGLGPAHAFLHAALHRAHYLSVGVTDRLKWLYDFCVLGDKFSRDDWERLRDVALDKGLCGICLDARHAAEAVFGASTVPMPPDVQVVMEKAQNKEAIDVRRLGDWGYMQYRTFLTLPTHRLRLRWVWQRIWPSRDYMAHLYGRHDLGYAGLMGVRVRTAVRRFLGLKVTES